MNNILQLTYIVIVECFSDIFDNENLLLNFNFINKVFFMVFIWYNISCHTRKKYTFHYSCLSQL